MTNSKGSILFRQEKSEADKDGMPMGLFLEACSDVDGMPYELLLDIFHHSENLSDKKDVIVYGGEYEN